MEAYGIKLSEHQNALALVCSRQAFFNIFYLKHVTTQLDDYYKQIKALKCRTRRNLFQLFIYQEENDVPRPHPHEGGQKALVQGREAFCSYGGQTTLPRTLVEVLLGHLGLWELL